MTAICIAALFVSGLLILIAHPRFYLGEAGGLGGPSLFDLPMERIRRGAGWPRALHFLMAWVIVATGAVYVTLGLITGHFRRRFSGARSSSTTPTEPAKRAQRIAYASVVFALFPVIAWTGLAMSPAVTTLAPWLVVLAGGHQSARTIHFFASVGLMLFIAGHLLMVWRAGFVEHVGPMIVNRRVPGTDDDFPRQPARRRVLATGLGVAAIGIPFGVSKLKRAGLVPPDAEGVLGIGETLTYATHRLLLSGGTRAREFTRADISAVAPINGRPPKTELYQSMLNAGFSDYKLVVDGLVERPGEFSLDALRQLPSRTQITNLVCEEGWSYIAEWRGVLLEWLLKHVGVSDRARYVAFFAFDKSWNSLDMGDAMHSQTMLAYDMNGQVLPAGHGAPLRLHTPLHLGYKQTKYVTRVLVVDSLAEVRNGLGALAPESGYSWYAGI